MVLSSNLGYPRIGPKRELKKAVESYWAGETSESQLLETCRALRRAAWRTQQELGLNHIPSNDFSLYDHVLDTTAMVGAVPVRYGGSGEAVDTATYFAMARGSSEAPAMEMTKWFDTNYHYIVPELAPEQPFRLASTKPIDMFNEAKEDGIHTRPVLVGPVSYLLLGKSKAADFQPLALLDRLLPVYEEVLRRLAAAGADWVQIDEPWLVLDLSNVARTAFRLAFERLAAAAPGLKILVASYFGDLRENLPLALSLPVAAVHLDLVRAPDALEWALARTPERLALSLGVVNGRNIWRTDLGRAMEWLERAVGALGRDRVLVGPSCSMLHCPVDLAFETDLDGELKEWLAFAKQKIGEIVLLTRALNEGRAAVEGELRAGHEATERRRASPRVHDPAVKQRGAAITEDMTRRQSPYSARRDLQRRRLELPRFPTTTIGSFPQTREVRAARAAFKSGKQSEEEYVAFLKQEIAETIQFQEEIGLDVLVHGEFERNDMVEYFGEQLDGFAFTKNGWVQSYGSRCVKPPIIYGDIRRPRPMTVEWSKFAQSLTAKPVKGMLTGPVTILQWSFVRDDQPRAETCRQIALAIRDEAVDLEAAGIKAIQIDEPAFREGLPLRRADGAEYLRWAVECFRLASSGVRDETQIHTHMCYSEFNDILDAIAAMDADVISIEASRSGMELLAAFARFQFPNEIGPGVYDIHSPRVPAREEIEELLRRALLVLSPEQLWVNPDCGLKTRKWEEVDPALSAMVKAAAALRLEAS
jgi:5-methyltetrahydropteroyltriglutamate--homocysteine methyltransferase